ncbi:MAG: radical SAM protein [Clostridia bacterium]|nr:radical SAM protein [Clostridia bacterium]
MIDYQEVNHLHQTYANFPFHLKHCVWELTLACCFHCAYCGSSGGKARDNELSTDECLDIVGQLAELGCRRVSLIGGEVFMRRDWDVISEALIRNGIITSIITNGYQMTPEILQRLKELRIESVAVSLDGPESVHDAFRQRGSYSRAMQTINAVADAGIPVSIITALRSDNAPLLPEFFGIIRNLPIFAWQIQACSPMGNADKNGVSISFDAGTVIRFVKSVNGTVPFYVGVADNIGYYTAEEPEIRGVQGRFFTGCTAGLKSIGIDSVGNVRGCESMQDDSFNEGNLREKSLLSIWMDPNSFSYNRDFNDGLLTGSCKGCPKGNICAGGCRSYNYFTTGKLYQNPLCARNKVK